MAKRANPRSKQKSNLNTKWLNNALKSIGSATAATFKDIAPNIYDTGETAIDAGTKAVRTIRGAKGSINKISKQLSSNKYVRMAKDSVNRSLEDLKTGNLYNPNRDTSGDEDMDWGDFMDDFDSMDSSEGNVTFNYIDTSDNSNDDGNIALADAISRSSQAQMKASKANIDTMVSLASASIMSNQQALDNINGNLMNIDSTLTSILEYHQQNTTSFYESAIAAFEQIGNSLAKSKEDDYSSRSDDSIASLFNSKGGLDINNYKNYVKKQIKKSVEGSPAGMILPFLQDDNMLEMLISDPVGGLTKGVIGGMIPQVIQGTLSELDKTFSNLLPNMLAKLGKEADKTGASTLTKMLGKIFGIRITNTKNIDLDDRFNGEAATFDDVTRNSIVEVLPKYARESTQYLREIAAAVTKKDPDKIKDDAQIFDLNTSSYTTATKLREELAKSIQDSIVSAFQSSDFGKIIQSVGGNLAGEQQKAFQKVTNELYTQLAKIEGSLEVSDFDFKNKDSKVRGAMKSVSKGTKEEKEAYNLVQEAMRYMYANNIGIDTATKAQIDASVAKSNKLKELSKNPEFSNIIAAGINSNTDMDAFVDKYTGNTRAIKYQESIAREEEKREKQDEKDAVRDANKLRNRSVKKEVATQITNYQEYEKSQRDKELAGKGKISATLFGEDFGASVANMGTHAKNSMWAVMKGDTAGAGREFAAIFGDMAKATWESTKKNFLTPLKNTFFGEKDDNGYTHGGLFEVTQNKAKDTFKEFMQKINGKDYVDSKGNTHSLGEDDTSFVGEASKVMESIKKGIQVKLFGDKEADDEEKRKGILNKAAESIGRGLAGWKEAIFGGDEEDKLGEEDKKSIKEAMLKVTPKAALGATAGMFTGLAAGSSLLGTMIGGPVGGAVLGLAGGILSNSDKFKNYLFGPEVEDPDGTKRRVGGIISSKTQDYFKKNKNFLIGGAALGAIKGMIFPGAGLMTSIVGGPIAGAAMGIGTSMLVKSKMFQEFLYGNEEKGKEGVISAFKSLFNKGEKTGDKDDAGFLKKIGMGALGAGVGALSAGIIGKVGIMGALAGPAGPIGAAIGGAAIGIASQGEKFKNWMFGEKDEDGKRHGGMIQKFQNWMHVEVVGPISASAANMADDFKTFLKFDVLEKVRLPFLALRDGIRDSIQPFVDKSKEMLGDIIQKVTKPIGEAVTKFIVRPAQRVLRTASNMLYKGAKIVIGAPFKLLGSIAKHAKKKVDSFFSFGKRIFKSTILTVGKATFKLFKDVGSAGVNFIGKGVDKVRSGVANIKDKHPKAAAKVETVRSKYNNLRAKMASDPWFQDWYSSNAEKFEERQKNKNAAKDRNSLVANRRLMAQFLGYDVKDFTEENMLRAEEAAKAQGKNIHGRWKRDSKGEIGYDETTEQILKKSNATLATEGETSTNPEIRAIGQRENILYTLKEQNDLIRQYMENGHTEEEAKDLAKKDIDSITQEMYENGINPDGTVDYDRLEESVTGKKKKSHKGKKKKKNKHNQDNNADDLIDITDFTDDELRDFIVNDRSISEIRASRENKNQENQDNNADESSMLDDIRNSGNRIADRISNSLDNFFGRNNRARAEGGPVEEDKAYLVGDGGTDPSAKEIFVPKTSGKILSQSKGGIKVQIEGIASKALESIKSLFSWKKKEKEKEEKKKFQSGEAQIQTKEKGTTENADFEDVVVESNDGVSVARMTKKQAAMYNAAVDVRKDREAAQLDKTQDDEREEKVRNRNSYASQKKAEQEEEDRKEKRTFMNKVLQSLTAIGSDNKEHQSLWSKIWDNKKGILGSLLVLGLPWLVKNFPNLVNSITGFLGNIGETLKEGFQWTNEHDARTNGETVGERVADNVEDSAQVVKDLAQGKFGSALSDFVLDEGQYDAGSGARVEFLANKGFDLANTKGGKFVANTGKSAVKGAKNGVRSLVDKVKSKITGKKAGAKAAQETINYYGLALNPDGSVKLGEEVATLADDAVKKPKGFASKAKNLASKGTDKVKDIAKAGLDKVKSTSTGKVISNIGKNSADDVVESAVKTGAKKVAGESAESVIESTSKTGIKKVLGMVDDFLAGLIEKCANKFSKSGASGALKGCLNGIKSKISKAVSTHFPWLAEKIGITTSAHAAADAATLGLDKVVFCTVGAINGISGTAKLFYVDKSQVDWKMKIISAAINALTAGTTIGSIVDIISSLMADIFGMDLLNAIAVAIYKAISGKEDEEKLDAAAAEFKNNYDAYQTEQIEQQYETQKAAGLIDSNLSLEEFTQGAHDGTYKVDYKSFTDYNADQHQSIGYKIGKGFTNAGKGIKKFFGGEKSYVDEASGNTYADNGDGTYTVYDSSGKSLGNVSKDSVDVSTMTESTKGGVKNAVKKAGSVIKNGAIKVGGMLSKAVDTVKTNLNPVENAKKVAKFGKWLISKETKKIYRNETDGSYYDGTGKHFNGNGDEIGGDIDVSTLSAWTASGLLTPDEIVTKESGAKQIWNTVTGKINDAKAKAKETLNNFSQGVKDKVQKAAVSLTNFTSKYNETFVGGKQEAWYMKDGSGYYRFNGAKYIKCTMDGDTTGEELAKADFKALLDSGVLEKGKSVKVDSKVIAKTKELGHKAWEGIIKIKDTVISDVKKKSKEIAENAKKLATGAKNLFTKHKDVAWYLTDGSGFLRKSGEGYAKYNMNGDLIASGILETDFKSMMDSGLLKEGEEITVDSGITTGFKSLTSKIATSWKEKIGEVSAMWDTISSGASDFVKAVKEDGFGATVAGFFKSTKKTAWYRIDGSGYYVMQDNGNYTYYNMNGDVISDSVKGDDVQEMINTGTVTEGEIIEDSKAKEAIKSITGAVKDAWEKAKDTVTNKWEEFKDWIGGGGSGDGTNIMNTSSTGGSGRGRKAYGGRGTEPETVNGHAYYSQNDSKWKDDAYVSMNAQDGATMGDSGCGPTAMAMVAGDAANKNVTPTDMAKLAAQSGFRDSTGTNAQFIDYASDYMGLPHDTVEKPSADYIKANAMNGNTMILNGVSGDGGAFTSAGHYVVVVGTDNNGNILVNDPRGKSYSRPYSAEELAKQTNIAWDYRQSTGGFGRALKKRITNRLKKLGGKGGNRFTAEDVIKIAKSEVGYSEKASNNSLDDPTANAGSGNYTKFASIAGHTNGLAWCATFVTSCFVRAANGDKDHAKSVLCGANTASCATNQNAFRSAGQLTQTPQPGDVVFFLNGSSHTGLVTAVNGNTITTVEGNTSPGKFNRDGGCVAEHTYTLPYAKISGYGRPKYDTTSDWTGETSNYSSAVSGGSVDGTSAATTETSLLDQFSSGLSSIAQQYTTAALTGNYDATFSLNPTTTSTGTTDTSSGANVASANISGSDVAKNVWNYFTKDAGYSKQATAGIMGNLYQESGMNPANTSGKVAGGLAQWERYDKKTGRWKKLYDYAASKGKDWTDVGAQVEFINQELQGLDHYFRTDIPYGGNIAGSTLTNAGATPTTFEQWKKSTDVDMATRQFEGAFERAGKPMIEKRVSYAKKYYDLYAGGSGTGKGGAGASLRNRRRGGRGDFETTESFSGISGNEPLYDGVSDYGTYSSTSLDSMDYSVDNFNSNYSGDYSGYNNTTTSVDMTKVENLLSTVVDVLNSINTNTGKLDGLSESLKTPSSGTNGNTTNILVDKSKNSTVNSKNDLSMGSIQESKNSLLAAKIAKGTTR